MIEPCFLSSRTRLGLCCSHPVLRVKGKGKVFPLHARCGQEGGYFTLGKDSVPIVQGAGWAQRPIWTDGKSSPHRNSLQERPTHSQSLYRLSYQSRTSTSCLFTIRTSCLIDWFHCLLLACLVANIVVIWIVTFSPVSFYLFVQMDYWFSVWLPLLLPSFCVVFLAAKFSVPFEVHRYTTGAHIGLRESKVLLVRRIRPLQICCGLRGYCDGTNLVTRPDINFCFPQNNNVISRIYCTCVNASFLIFRK